MKKPAIDYWRYLTKVRIKGKFSDQEIYAVLLLLLWLFVFFLVIFFLGFKQPGGVDFFFD